jgi:hypothetical protein
MFLSKKPKIIIWGYPLHTHTHSYIHFGYYRAFKSLGYETYWLDNRPYQGLDLENSLVITEHFATSWLPLSKSSTYFVHYLGNKNDNHKKYLDHVDRLVDVRYNADNWVDKNYDYVLDRSKLEKIGAGTFLEKDEDYDRIYTTWATDLLPEEINLEDRFINRENKVHYIGTIGGGKGGLFDCQKAPDYYDTVPYIMPFYEECKKNGIEFLSNCPWVNPLSPEENISKIKSSYLAPDFRHKAMLDWGYIPCRVMKNISYGQLGLTNSLAVQNFFEGEVIYNQDSAQLFYDGRSKMKDYDLIKKQMLLVKENHTYINRALDIIKVYESR